MDFEVIWTEPAVADLEAAVRYMAERSPEAAESLRLELLASVEVLARFPFIGPAYERDRTGHTREICAGATASFIGCRSRYIKSRS